MNQDLVRIDHSMHPLANLPRGAGVRDAGRVEDDRLIQRILLLVSPTVEKQAALRDFLDQQQNRSSKDFHHWLAPAEYALRFGPAADDLQTALAWLRQSGLTVTKISNGGGWIEFAGNSRQINQTFHTELRYFSFAGKRYIGNASDISLPENVARISPGLASLNNFPRTPSHRFSRPSKTGIVDAQHAQLTPHLTATGNSNTYYLAPGDFAAIYNTKPLLAGGTDGSGIAIAVTAQSQIELTDVQAFRKIFQLKVNDPNIVLSGPDPGIASPVDQQEATLDVEWAGAVAPGATVDLVLAASTDASNGVDLAAAFAVDNSIAPILTYTYGGCEQALGLTGNAFYEALWQQAAAEGITVLVATGDSGSAGCDAADTGAAAVSGLAVNGAATTPYNVAVGGTQFVDTASPPSYWSATNAADYSSALGYIPEAAWNESCDPLQPLNATNCVFESGTFSSLAGGGGASTVYPKPAWQAGPGVPADGFRDIPDVALAAASGHDDIVYCNSLGGTACEINSQNQVVGLTLAGGTSAATPAMAGLLALVEQKNGAFQGQINYTLYKLAENYSCDSSAQTSPGSQNACVFYDVTMGNNAVPCQGESPQCSSTTAGTNGFLDGQPATAGYDLATGLGSLNATNLANNWNSVSFLPSQTRLQLPTTSFVHGSAVTVTGTVAPASGAGAPTGSIALRTDSFGSADHIPVENGSFSAQITDLPGGQYVLSAHYPGDGSYAASDSNDIRVDVATESSTTTLTTEGAQSGAIPYGDSLAVLVKVQGLSLAGAATGTVTLKDGATTVGTYSLTADGGVYIPTGSGAPYSFPVGSHTITAAYSGDNSFNASSSAPLAFTVGKSDPLVIVGLNAGTVDTTQPIGVHVVVAGFGTALATGFIQFTVDGQPYGSALALQSGGFFGTQAQVSTLVTGLPAGTHSIAANYDGSADPNYASIAGSDTAHEPNNPSVTVTAGSGAATTTTLNAITLPVSLGDTGKFTITVTPSNATGTFTLWDAVGARSSPAGITGGSATIQFPWTQGGMTALYAIYSGDSTRAPSSSSAVTFSVRPGVPTVALSAPSIARSNQQVSLDATITGKDSAGKPITSSLPSPTGVVEFWDAANGAAAEPIAAENLTAGAAGTAVYGLRVTLSAGNHSLRVHYRGDINWQAVDSTTVQVSSMSPADFSVGIAPGVLSLVAGASGSAIVTVTPAGGFTGDVSLLCPSGSAFPVTGYLCSFTPSSTINIGGTTPGSLTLNLEPTSIGVLPSGIRPTATFQRQVGLELLAVLAALSVLLFAVRDVGQQRDCGRFAAARGGALLALSLLLGCGGGGGGGGGSSAPVRSTTTLTSTNPRALYETPVTFNAIVNASGSPGGTVQLIDNGQIYSSGMLSGGVATFAAAALPVGVHVLVAQYSGDAHTKASSSAPITQVITGSVNLPVTATSAAGTHTASVTVSVN